MDIHGERATHARRCLERLGISLERHGFEGIIDVRAVGNITKHQPKAFQRAMKIDGVWDPATCLFADDSSRNIRTAKELGWNTVLVGPERDGGKEAAGLRHCREADWQIANIHGLRETCPEIFFSGDDGGGGDRSGGGESKQSDRGAQAGLVEVDRPTDYEVPTAPFQVVPFVIAHTAQKLMGKGSPTGESERDDFKLGICSVCGHKEENYVCCKCFRMCCGRHVRGHMVAHSADSGHAIALGVMDLSMWCFSCDAYLDVYGIPALRTLYTAAHVEKFGEAPPGAVFDQAQGKGTAALNEGITLRLELAPPQSFGCGDEGEVKRDSKGS